MDALQLDLATIVGRLEQVQDEGGWETADSIVAERILTCDLPRLREHLSPEALALLDRARRNLPEPLGDVATDPAEVPASDGEHCCDSMRRFVAACGICAFPCDCPDNVVRYAGAEYRLPVRDGGQSYIVIRFCPWCGKPLPESSQ